MFEQKAKDTDIIRNLKKVMTIRDNALMIADIQKSHSSFAQFIAEWPSDNIIGLWLYLKKHGSRLGGNTGPYALRTLGKDTFLLSRDVEGYFKSYDIISGGTTSKRSLEAIQNTFNEWQQQSQRSLQDISQIVSMATGDNFLLPED